MKYHKVKATIRHMGGGGSSSPTVVQNIPDWMVPALHATQQEAADRYIAGDLSKVAGTNRNLDVSFDQGAQGIIDSTVNSSAHLNDQAERFRSEDMLGGNAKGTTDQMNLAIGQATAGNNATFGANGTLGSARNVRANADSATEAGVKAAQQIFSNKMEVEKGVDANAGSQLQLISGATGALSGLGQQQRAIEQQQLDAPWQGLQRAASTIYGNPARQTATQAQGGK